MAKGNITGKAPKFIIEGVIGMAKVRVNISGKNLEITQALRICRKRLLSLKIPQ